jgi:hypothetical protein
MSGLGIGEPLRRPQIFCIISGIPEMLSYGASDVRLNIPSMPTNMCQCSDCPSRLPGSFSKLRNCPKNVLLQNQIHCIPSQEELWCRRLCSCHNIWNGSIRSSVSSSASRVFGKPFPEPRNLRASKRKGCFHSSSSG